MTANSKLQNLHPQVTLRRHAHTHGSLENVAQARAQINCALEVAALARSYPLCARNRCACALGITLSSETCQIRSRKHSNYVLGSEALHMGAIT